MSRTSYPSRTPAAEMLQHRRAWRIDDLHYEVVNRSADERYDVTLEPSGELECTCTAGRFRTPCWHEGVVARRLVREGLPHLFGDDLEDAG